MSVDQITQSNLDQFYGTENYYKHGLVRNVLLTDGAQFLNSNGAGWLIDEIATNQINPIVKANSGLQEFQLWELKVTGTKAVLTLREDSGEPAIIEKKIEFTDFPLSDVKLYVEPGEYGKVILLASEH